MTLPKILLPLFAAACFFTVSTNAQCPPGTVNSGFNLVTNGSFELGNTGFTSSYTFCDQEDCLYNQGFFAVDNDPSFYHNNFEGDDHTSGSGNFMIVNGANVSGVSVWCQTVTVTPNTTYLFSTWVTSVNASNPASLQFAINGTPLGSTFNAPAFTFGFFWPGWTQFSTSWNSGSNTTATICITNQNTAVGGNDFGLDDISFIPCVCSYQAQPIPNASICEGNNTVLTATAGATAYEWFPATGLSCTTCMSVVADPVTTTTYTMVATANLCTDTVTTVVTVNPLPNASAGSDIGVCAGQSASLLASGGTSYAWSPATGLSATNVQNPTVTPSVTTTYTVTVTNAGGCTATDEVVVTVQNTGSVTVGNDTAVCAGSAASLTASGAASYLWLPTAAVSCSTCPTTTATPVTSTTYTVMAGSGACSVTLTVAVDVLPVPTANAGNDTSVCEGQPVLLQGSGGASFEWTPTAGLDNAFTANPTATPTVTTTYTLTTTGASGCVDTDEVVITVLNNGTVTAGNDTSVCEGNSVNLFASGASSYAWSPSSVACPTCPVTTATPAVSTTYTVVTTENGCNDTLSVEVIVLPQPVAFAGNDTSVCPGQAVALQGSGVGTYAWSPTTGLSNATVANPLATVTQAITYTLTVTGNGGCTSTDEVALDVITNATITAGTDTTVCAGNAVNLTASGAADYAWSPNTGVACATCANTTANPASTTTYTLVGSANGCVDSVNVVVTVLDQPTANAGADLDVCANENFVLEGSGGNTYAWSPSNGLVETNVASPSGALTVSETYVLTVTNGSFCFDTDTVTVTVHDLPIATVTPDDTVCIGNEIDLTAGGGVSYTWSPATGLNATSGSVVTATVTNDVTYVVNVTDENGCTATAQTTIAAVAADTVQTVSDTLACYGQPITLSAFGGVTYNWEGPEASCSDCPTVSFVVTRNGVYTVTAIDTNSCASEADVNVFVDHTCEQIVFPNVFSPNGDGHNDYFFPITKGMENVRFYVYNRWGEMVYDGMSNNGWNGVHKNIHQPVGTYAWYATGLSVTGKTVKLKGHVTLLR